MTVMDKTRSWTEESEKEDVTAPNKEIRGTLAAVCGEEVTPKL